MFIFFPALPDCVNILKHIPIPRLNKTPVWLPKDQQKQFIPLFRNLLSNFNMMKPLNFHILENIQKIQIQIITVVSGHPFTIGKNTIVFPLSYLMLPLFMQKKILIHELVHLHQRRAPEIYERYYTNQLNFKKIKVNLPEEVKARLMYNPDGPRYEWIWRNRYIPLGIKHKTYLWDVNTKTLNPVEQVKEYTQAFNTLRQLYHPNEIVAHQITDAIKM